MEVQKLHPEVAQTLSLFGVSGAVEKGTAMLASHFEMLVEGIRSGAVYVFELQESGMWEQKQKLVAEDAIEDNAMFGLDLSLSGNTLLVGAPGFSDRGSHTGKAYIFERDEAGAWNMVAELAPDDRMKDDNFGISVSLDGDKAIVGILRPSVEGDSELRAYVFERNTNGVWKETARLKPPQETLEWFGFSVSISKNTAVVGSYGNKGFLGEGSAHVYERMANGSWVHVQQLQPVEERDSGFGRHVEVQNDTALVAVSNDLFLDPQAGIGFPGAVYVYERNMTGYWHRVSRLLSEEGKEDSFGFSFSLHADKVIVGAWSDSTEILSGGSAYIFQRTGSGQWEKAQVLTPYNQQMVHAFGTGVSTDGTWYYVGAVNDSERILGGGAAFMFASKDALPPSGGSSRSYTALIVSVTIGACLAIIVGIVWIYVQRRREARKRVMLEGIIQSRKLDDGPETSKKLAAYCFSYPELLEATENFSEEFAIGEGGFGPVYRGKLSDGTFAAIKKLSSSSQQGEQEFLQEVDTLTRCPHPHVVPLMGYCTGQDEHLLVYRFMPGGSLHTRLKELNWETKEKVALQCSQALAYFHTCVDPPILHRDFKSDNILLDIHDAAFVADLGLAQLAGDKAVHKDDVGAVAMCCTPAGTIGYMAPEYIQDGLLSTKVDVYSFGIVMLEMLANRGAISLEASKSQRFLSSWLRPYLDDVVEFDRLLGGKLLASWPRDHLESFCLLAKECTSDAPEERPTMQEVALRLSLLVNDKKQDFRVSAELSEDGDMDSRSCLICMNRRRQCRVLPCGHNVLCKICREVCEANGEFYCPLCRVKGEAFVNATSPETFKGSFSVC